MSYINLGITLLVLICAVWSLVILRRSKKRALNKAQLSAKIGREIHPGHTRFTLDICNNSDYAEARNIKLLINDIGLKDHPVTRDGNPESIDFIGPRDPVKLNMNTVVIQTGDYDSFNVEIFWEDDSGEKGYHRTILRI